MVIESVGEAVAGVPATASVIMNVFSFQPLLKNPIEAGVSGSIGAYTESKPEGGGLFPPPSGEFVLFLQALPVSNKLPAMAMNNLFLNLIFLFVKAYCSFTMRTLSMAILMLFAGTAFGWSLAIKKPRAVLG